jgi:hypothetical protein
VRERHVDRVAAAFAGFIVGFWTGLAVLGLVVHFAR